MYNNCMDFWKADVTLIVSELATRSANRDTQNEDLKSFETIPIGGYVYIEETEGSWWEVLDAKLFEH